jgi:hypothetical protein
MTGSSDAHEDGVFISTELMEFEQGITSKWSNLSIVRPYMPSITMPPKILILSLLLETLN